MNMTEKLAARLPMINERVDRRPVVAVVRLQGVISPNPSPVSRGTINLNVVESALKRAFEHDRLLAVALAINSPGGAPTQSALVAERIRQLAADKKVPVLAFCEDVAASGGYWLACAADEIYAHATSMVGSIGVVSAGFGFEGLLERFGVQRRVHTAGTHKVRLDPFGPESDEDVAWLRGLHAELHEQFIDLVKQRRGGKLTGSDDELFNGEVWTGKRAVELGLVDELGTMRGVLAKRFGDAHRHRGTAAAAARAAGHRWRGSAVRPRRIPGGHAARRARAPRRVVTVRSLSSELPIRPSAQPAQRAHNSPNAAIVTHPGVD